MLERIEELWAPAEAGGLRDPAEGERWVPLSRETPPPSAALLVVGPMAVSDEDEATALSSNTSRGVILGARVAVPHVAHTQLI